ncbi:hypothetical protein NIES267_25890 [Calothrix parasitica NIES-267]|uniref:Uncharacterized protein n=1 Tax=Calothrix parasitica NIES-267 TaxID=1973488 RepID=A0A1Z4LPH0_9CYAN|nr:hypothetical protein NIES267_25890 [Calothrix parasitica NIES-267]
MEKCLLLRQRFKLLAPVMNPDKNKLKFPFWQYLNQPLFCEKLILNPHTFAYVYRIELLERCWGRECDAKGQSSNGG